ncbi:hypothetical protein JTB14_009159 [Gonioctena quinquepunctata]|nr:hypothetical protein JTB14_009159 [Gonioctena quinquepunctata]
MSWRQDHECYTDNIKVKISERYKPPPRINLAVTYAQRLILNKQTRDNITNHDFNLEKKVLQNMKEWKTFRATASQERRTKIEKAREEIKKKELENIKQEQLDEVELKTVHETVATNNNFISTQTNISFAPPNQSYVNYSTNNSILVPTQATNYYSNILTPIPLHNYGNQQYNCKPNDKSPFNLSDFENDTSSPFDNMELKSINDMEELAQVLNRDDTNYKLTTPVYSNYQRPQVTTSHISTYSSYPSNQFSYIPPSVPYVQPSTNDFSQTNGYYYSQNQPSNTQYFYSKPSTLDYSYTQSVQSSPMLETSLSNYKSVPDIVKAVEEELVNTRIGTSAPRNSFMRTNTTSQINRPKSTDAVYPRPKIKAEELDDPFDLLTMPQQEVCRSICSMGFPLSRVARTFKILGDDRKKMVEHLLALSELLDLGFPEKDASNALIQCDNDRDKALDKLIS